MLQAMSWWHHYQHQSMMEQALVYWLAPFGGALLGGLLYRCV
jgi:glycerol uptake facilitator-like aquaporin